MPRGARGRRGFQSTHDETPNVCGDALVAAENLVASQPDCLAVLEAHLKQQTRL